MIVTREGFADDAWSRDPSAERRIAPLEEIDAASTARGLDLPNDADPAAVAPAFDNLELIAIAFPSFGDGRGFSLARRLRALGFGGRLRASGHVLSDQFSHALACGFDEVEIDAALAARQPEPHWRAAAEAPPSYQRRLFG